MQDAVGIGNSVGFVADSGVRIWYEVESRNEYGAPESLTKIPIPLNLWMTLTWRLRNDWKKIERMPKFIGRA